MLRLPALIRSVEENAKIYGAEQTPSALQLPTANLVRRRLKALIASSEDYIYKSQGIVDALSQKAFTTSLISWQYKNCVILSMVSKRNILGRASQTCSR